MKKLKIILSVLAIMSLACVAHAQERIAVFIVGDYEGIGVPSQHQWNDGDLGGNQEWDEFWNDTYLLWEMFLSQQSQGGYGYYNDYIYVLFADGNNYQPPDYDERYIVPQFTAFTDDEATYDNVKNLFEDMVTGENETVPQLTENDFLFIWTMGHGGSNGNDSYIYLMDNIMTDTEFAGLVNNITAQKKVIWMQQGFAGGFADNFSGNNTIFYSACQSGQNAHRANDTPYLENELWDIVPYHHGEYNFHTYSPVYGLSPSYDPEYNGNAYTNADIDENNIISISEAYSWESSHSNTSESSVFIDPGEIANTTSLKYPIVLSEDISNTKSFSGFIGITKPVHVLSGATLTFTDARVFLDYEGELIIDEGATLIIDDNVEITAWCNYTQKQIVVNGNVDIGSEVIFLGENVTLDDNRLKLIINNPSISVTFDNLGITNTVIETHNSNNTFINECIFRYSELRGSNGNFTIDNASFLIESTVNLINNGEPRYTYLTFSEFEESLNHKGITIENYPTVRINDSEISGRIIGIELFNCGKNNVDIHGCLFNGCSNTGILVYNSKVNISDNNVSANGYGLKCLNRSNVALFGNCEYITQEFKESTYCEITGSEESFPYYFKYNSVKYDINTNLLLEFKLFGDISLDVRDNTWNIANPTPYFKPSPNYLWQPAWVPGDCGYKSSEIPENMFFSAKEKIEIENHIGAKDEFKQLINDYPSSQYSQAALREIFEIEEFCENDFELLKNYYKTNQNIQNDLLLTKRADFLATFCNIKIENWEEAINWFESAILNPESEEDSIFAIIDLGYTYFIMNNGGQKSTFQGNLTEYIPATQQQFKGKRDYLLNLIPGDQMSEKMKGNISALKEGKLLQNVPNPFQGSTQIWYKINTESNVQLNVYNYTGQLINNTNEGTKTKGTHFIDFDATGLKNGIYFYSININGKTTDSKKMTVMK
ncbi:MAG: T9SS type A sorting domain-containing protein [Bacteroidales bacterium]|nr:T9SS type A sorting domain-containing protein [Bacteroidales bacterium]